MNQPKTNQSINQWKLSHTHTLTHARTHARTLSHAHIDRPKIFTVAMLHSNTTGGRRGGGGGGGGENVAEIGLFQQRTVAAFSTTHGDTAYRTTRVFVRHMLPFQLISLRSKRQTTIQSCFHEPSYSCSMTKKPTESSGLHSVRSTTTLVSSVFH